MHKLYFLTHSLTVRVLDSNLLEWWLTHVVTLRLGGTIMTDSHVFSKGGSSVKGLICNMVASLWDIWTGTLLRGSRSNIPNYFRVCVEIPSWGKRLGGYFGVVSKFIPWSRWILQKVKKNEQKDAEETNHATNLNFVIFNQGFYGMWSLQINLG